MKTGLQLVLTMTMNRLALVIAMIFTTGVCRGQGAGTFYGSGGSTNTAPNVFNLAFGDRALTSINNQFSHFNTAIGPIALLKNTTGNNNTALGYAALEWYTSANDNTAVGFLAMNGIVAGSTGRSNTAVGSQALQGNASGNFNIAVGHQSLYNNDRGSFNTATGYQALQRNNADFNTAYGGISLFNNSAGVGNTASGYASLFYNDTGYFNTANGYAALFSNTSGFNNTAAGYSALASNTSGYNNTAGGYQALFSATTGSNNTANGVLALFSATTGSANSASGYGALYGNTTGAFNTAVGYSALNNNSSGNNNLALGYGAGQNLTTGNDNIVIGNPGQAGESGTTRIGTSGTHLRTFVAGINGVNVGQGVPVYINAAGQLGTLTSSRRFKDSIKNMGATSDQLMKLRPVTFRYKQPEPGGKRPTQYGLIAEEVAKVYPNLVQYDKAGKPFTIYYHLLAPMLLNELQKEHRRYEAQRTEIAALKSELAAMRQSQDRQARALAKVMSLVESSQVKAHAQKAKYAAR